MDPQAAFQILQPTSIAVARDQSIASVQSLRCAVKQVVATEDDLQVSDDSSCINQMKEYLVFPLFIILKSGKKLSWSFLEEIVSCVLEVLNHSEIEDFNFFNEIFTQFFILLTNKEDPRQEKKLSEECKQMTLTAITTLIHNSTRNVHDKMNSNIFRPQFGHAVFICLKLAQEEKNRSLKIEAIKCLMALGQQKSFNNMSTKKQDELSSNMINYLPGIVTGLAKIVTADEKQGNQITSAAIDAWIYFVVLVMRDEFLEKSMPHFEESDTVAQLRNKLFKEKLVHKETKQSTPKDSNKFYIPEPDEKQDLLSKLPSVQLNRKWVHETAGRLVILIQSMIKQVNHPHWRVRLSLIHFAEKIICKCHKSLSNALVLALQVIVTMRSDEVVDVGVAAQNALLSVMNVIGEGNGSHLQKGLYELLEEHVYALCTQLPTVFKQQDDVKILSVVRQLEGCLEVLGSRISQLMTWPTHSVRLLRSLRFGLTLDISDSDLLLERTNAEDPFSVLAIKPSLGRNFRYFQDARVYESISALCNLLGYHSNITLICDSCVELLQETQCRKETLIMFTLIIQGKDNRKMKDKDGDCVSSEENEKVVRSILDAIISLDILDVPLSISSNNNSNANDGDDQNLTQILVPINKPGNLSIDMVKNNVLLVANALNLVSASAQMMGKDFEMFLSSILCSVMEKTGDANVLVGYTGRNTLEAIAQACQYKDIAKLIENSVPYYWYTLSLKLKRVVQYPSAPLVLQVCMEYASIDVLAFTEELVQEILVCLDTYHNNQAIPLLRVLLVYVMAVIRYEKTLTKDGNNSDGTRMDSLDKETKTHSENECNIEDARGMVSFLKDYHEKQVVIRKCLREEEELDGPTNPDELKKDYARNLSNVENEDLSETNDDSKPKAPVYVSHVVEILEKCSHLLFIQDRKVKLLILETIKVGSEALQNWENERLPVFHKLWKPLHLRLKDTDFVVMMRSFEVLTVMAVSSGEFLRRRILKEIFPVIFSFLKNQSIISLKKTRKSGYYMTTGYRAQCAILKRLPTLIDSLSLGVLEIGEVLHIVMLYTNDQQPQELVNLAMAISRQVSRIHPQHVWLVLAYQQPSVRIVPPSECLNPVQIRSGSGNHLTNEAVELFQQLS